MIIYKKYFFDAAHYMPNFKKTHKYAKVHGHSYEMIIKISGDPDKKNNWIIWLALIILWNYGFPQATPFQDVIVAVFLSILFIIIQLLQSRYLKKSISRSKFK